MKYSVKTIYHTLQGEGVHTGRAAVFLRFTGCNLWSGREKDRERAICRFCDTDFIGTDGPGGGVFEDPAGLAAAVASQWRGGAEHRWVVCTGGEPLLQLDTALVEALHAVGFKVAVETNGTRQAPPGLDWICVSPKAGTKIVIERGDEFKLVFPQAEMEPHRFEHLDFRHFFLQPMDGPTARENTRMAVDYCMESPKWRLGLQVHKIIGIA